MVRLSVVYRETWWNLQCPLEEKKLLLPFLSAPRRKKFSQEAEQHIIFHWLVNTSSKPYLHPFLLTFMGYEWSITILKLRNWKINPEMVNLDVLLIHSEQCEFG